MNLLNKSLEIAGGVDNTPTIVRRPSRDYNPSSGFNKLKALNIHNRSGKITLDGTASTSSAASKAPENFFRDRSTIENSKLTASSLVNFEVSRYSVSGVLIWQLRPRGSPKTNLCEKGFILPLRTFSEYLLDWGLGGTPGLLAKRDR